MASPRQWRDRLQPHPHLEDGSAYRQLRPTRLDKIKNLHSTDSIDTENLSTRGWSVWIHSSQVRLLDSSVPHNSRWRGWGRRDQAAPNLGTEPRYPVRI